MGSAVKAVELLYVLKLRRNEGGAMGRKGLKTPKRIFFLERPIFLVRARSFDLRFVSQSQEDVTFSYVRLTLG